VKKAELHAAISRGYREIAALTGAKCSAKACPDMAHKAYRCCDALHCRMTIEHAANAWGIKLPVAGHPLPLMGPSGCTALPHLRPWCSLHHCQIQAAGTTNDRPWDRRYFRLRNKLLRLEQQLADL
jgi:hypothetical protein